MKRIEDRLPTPKNELPPFQKVVWLYFKFTGRANLTQIWIHAVTWWAAIIGLNYLAYRYPALKYISLPAWIILIWSKIAAWIKRSHDLGNDGWYAVWSVIPIMNFVFLVKIYFDPGEEKENRFGTK